MVTTDYGFIQAFSRKLSDDDTLFGLVDGNFYVDFPMLKVNEKLGNTTDCPNRSIVSVSAPSIVSNGTFGSEFSGLIDVKTMFQVDVASQKGSNSEYCRQIGARVKQLVENDVVKTVGVQYVIYIGRVVDTTFWDEAIGAWHSAVICYGEYLRNNL
jgi:hypothetical protein